MGQDTAERQLRAYVLYSAGQLDCNATKQCRIVVKFKNGGTTPAYNVTAWADWKFSTEITESLFEALRYGETGKYSVDLGASETHNIIELSDSGQEYFGIPYSQSMFNDGRYLYVGGSLNIETSFKNATTPHSG